MMRAWLRCQRSWLVVEPLPAYAPELNPVEALWSSLKGVELANLAGDTLDDVIAAAERGIQRIRAPRTWITSGTWGRADGLDQGVTVMRHVRPGLPADVRSSRPSQPRQ